MQIPAGTENQDRGSAIMLIFWIQASVAMAIVATRFVARMLIKSVGVDDWLMLFTLVSVGTMVLRDGEAECRSVSSWFGPVCSRTTPPWAGFGTSTP
jgi:hypothetical protein